jgi:hypothetical protein
MQAAAQTFTRALHNKLYPLQTSANPAVDPLTKREEFAGSIRISKKKELLAVKESTMAERSTSDLEFFCDLMQIVEASSV